MNANPQLLRGLLLLGCVPVALTSLLYGGYPLSISEVGLGLYKGLLSQGEQAIGARAYFILTELRIPRMLGAFLVGAALAGAGAKLQALFRNPLADPSLIGISSGASMMAVLVLAMGATTWSLAGVSLTAYTLPVAAFVGALATAYVAFRVAKVRGKTALGMLLLVGIGLQFLTSAVTGICLYASNDEALRSITFWMMGSMSDMGWRNLGVVALFCAPAFVLFYRNCAALNAMQTGEETSFAIGVPVHRVKREVLVACTLAVGVTVAFCGMISFIGLVAPHLMRLVVGSDLRKLLPVSLVFGGVLCALADLLSRLLLAPEDLPISIITSLLGTPVFLSLLMRRRQAFAAQL